MAAFGRILLSTTGHVLSPFKQACSGCGKSLLESAQSWLSPFAQSQRSYVNWRMIRDAKKRKLLAEYSPERSRINAIRKNNILPKELQEIADKEVADLPRGSRISALTNRCVLTSRPRGKLRRWRLSRIQWRHLADYNKLSGVTRAVW